MTTGMNARVLGIVGAALLATLAGCGDKRDKVETIASEAPPADPSIRTASGFTPTQRLARVVELLNANDEKTAKAELRVLQAEAPDLRQAQVLQQSIYGNPYDIVPRGSFSYIVESGDTYVTLARDYLGDSYKFWALARISGIAPDMLKAGDIIQIPGRLREAGSAGTPRPRSATPYRPRRRPVAGAPGAVPPGAVPPGAVPPAGTPTAARTDPAEALRLRRQGLERMTAGQINAAVARLGRAQQLDPANKAIEADLARARRIQGAVRSRP